MRKITRLALLTGISAMAFGLAATPANAVPQYFSPSTLWEDESAESLSFDQAGAFGVGCIDPLGCTAGKLDVGDRLRGILRITTINLNPPAGIVPGSAAGKPELTAIFETEVTSKTLLFGTTFALTFGPGAALAADYGLAAGAMFAFYTDELPLVPAVAIGPGACTTIGFGGDCEGNVTGGGSKYLVIGMDGSDADEEWLAVGSDDVSLAALFTPSDPLGTFDVSLSILENYTGYTFGQVDIQGKLAFDGCLAGGDCKADVAMGGVVSGVKGLSTPYAAYDDTKFRFSATIPEPGSLLLLGTGLLGWAGFRRRRARA